jgi:uncharacterized protein YkwD
VKSFKFILYIVLSIFLLAFCFKACQDDTSIEDSSIEETSDSSKPSNSDHTNESDTPELTNNSDWPDSIFTSVQATPYLSQTEREVIVELNKCRTNPKKYAQEVLVPFLNSIDSNGIYVDSQGSNIRTMEGKPAIQEAISALSSQKPLPMLFPRKYLCEAATDHCNDQGPNSLVGHGGSDGSGPTERARRHNPNCGGVGENIGYGAHTATEIVRGLIVDDGVSDRGHRNNIFHNYEVVGVGIGDHVAYNTMCVIDFE